MKMHASLRRSSVLALGLLLATGSAAWAQSTSPTDTGQNPDTVGSMHPGRGDMMGTRGNMMGMHAMPATVDSVDQQSGLVEATSEGMKLKVHFPPSALANLKAGDKITLHMGFSKP